MEVVRGGGSGGGESGGSGGEVGAETVMLDNEGSGAWTEWRLAPYLASVRSEVRSRAADVRGGESVWLEAGCKSQS